MATTFMWEILRWAGTAIALIWSVGRLRSLPTSGNDHDEVAFSPGRASAGFEFRNCDKAALSSSELFESLSTTHGASLFVERDENSGIGQAVAVAFIPPLADFREGLLVEFQFDIAKSSVWTCWAESWIRQTAAAAWLAKPLVVRIGNTNRTQQGVETDRRLWGTFRAAIVMDACTDSIAARQLKVSYGGRGSSMANGDFLHSLIHGAFKYGFKVLVPEVDAAMRRQLINDPRDGEATSLIRQQVPAVTVTPACSATKGSLQGLGRWLEDIVREMNNLELAFHHNHNQLFIDRQQPNKRALAVTWILPLSIISAASMLWDLLTDLLRQSKVRTGWMQPQSVGGALAFHQRVVVGLLVLSATIFAAYSMSMGIVRLAWSQVAGEADIKMVALHGAGLAVACGLLTPAIVVVGCRLVRLSECTTNAGEHVFRRPFPEYSGQLVTECGSLGGRWALPLVAQWAAALHPSLAYIAVPVGGTATILGLVPPSWALKGAAVSCTAAVFVRIWIPGFVLYDFTADRFTPTLTDWLTQFGTGQSYTWASVSLAAIILTQLVAWPFLALSAYLATLRDPADM